MGLKINNTNLMALQLARVAITLNPIVGLKKIEILNNRFEGWGVAITLNPIVGLKKAVIAGVQSAFLGVAITLNPIVGLKRV